MTKDIKMIYEFKEDFPEKFIAIYSDGSGSDIFYTQKNGLFASASLDKGETVDQEWLIDAGYWYFIPLPDDFNVWKD